MFQIFLRLPLIKLLDRENLLSLYLFSLVLIQLIEGIMDRLVNNKNRHLTVYLPHEVLLYIVFCNEDSAFKAATFELQVLALSAEKVGFLFCLVVLKVLLPLRQPLLLLLLGGGLVLIQLLNSVGNINGSC